MFLFHVFTRNFSNHESTTLGAHSAHPTCSTLPLLHAQMVFGIMRRTTFVGIVKKKLRSDLTTTVVPLVILNC